MQPLPLNTFNTAGTTPWPVVFLHGFMGRATDWAAVGSRIDAACHAVDLPHHGDAPFPEPQTMADISAALAATFDAHGWDRVILAGYSMGGRAALHFACSCPERAGALVLESASPGLTDAEARAQRIAADETRAAALDALQDEAAFRDWLVTWYDMPLFATLHRTPGRVEQLIRMRMKNDPRQLAHALRGFGTGAQPSLWERLGEVHCPSLLLTGAEDAKFNAIAHNMASRLPNATHMIIADAGHNVHAETVERYTDALNRFLAALPRAD